MAENPLDVFGQYKFLDSGIFGTAKAKFDERYAILGGASGFEVRGYQRQPELRKKFEKISYYVSEDVLKLPEPLHIIKKGRLEPNVAKLYKKLDEELTAELDNDQSITISTALARYTKLHQVSCGWVKNDDEEWIEISTARADLFQDVISDIARSAPLVVFYRFKRDLIGIRNACAKMKRSVAEVSGARDQLAEWKAGKFNTVAIQIQAGSESIDVTRAMYCIYYSVNFSLLDFTQSQRRILRPGQERNVIFIYLHMMGTLDARLYRGYREKKTAIKGLLRRQ